MVGIDSKEGVAWMVAMLVTCRRQMMWRSTRRQSRLTEIGGEPIVNHEGRWRLYHYCCSSATTILGRDLPAAVRFTAGWS